MKFLSYFKSRRFKHGSFATVITVGIVVVLVLANVLVSMLSDRFGLELDLTTGNIYEITETTTDYLDQLEADINIYVLATEQNFTAANPYYVQANEVMQKYARYTERVSLDYIDVYTNPTFVNQYSAGENFKYGDIIVQCGKRYKALTGTDIFETSENGAITGSRIEQAITSAIMSVSDANPVTVGILTGFETVGVDALSHTLESNGYLVVDIDLMTSEIPADVSVLILASPLVDLDDLTIAKIETFLNNNDKRGRQLIYFASTSQPELPKTEAFLEEWGIEVSQSYLGDTNNDNVYYSPLYFTQNYVSQTFMEGINTDLTVLMPYPRALNLSWTTSPNGTIATDILLCTDETAVLIPPGVDETWDMYTEGEKGVYNTAVISTASSFDGLNKLDSNVVVFGSMDFLASTFTSMEALNNMEYVLNTINILTGKDKSGISIVSKVLGTSSLGISAGHAARYGLLFQYILPIAVMVTGIVVWVRRRHK